MLFRSVVHRSNRLLLVCFGDHFLDPNMDFERIEVVSSLLTLRFLCVV